MTDRVDILLATFQGASYLEEQLNSIFSQTYSPIHLWVRDDASTDQTLAILIKWALKYPEKMTVLPSTERLGVKGNFSELIKQSQAPYLMFADQDDYWLPHKVEVSLHQMKAMERQYGPHLPLLVHTDLTVVDQNLREIAPSFWVYANLKPHRASLNRLLAQNIVTGCTVLMNRPLADLAYPISSQAIMHDWWIALVAACFGQIQFIHQPTLLYRQHNSNDTGAKRYGLQSWASQSQNELSKKAHCMRQSYQQASCLLENYHHLLSSEKQALLKAYQALEKSPYFKKKYQIMKYQFFKQGLLRNIKMLLDC